MCPRVPAVAGVHTAFQAQCIRLLYPALLETEGAVVISDADMVPVSRRYFRRAVERIPEDHFVAFRDVTLASGEIPICYNAALPQTWRGVFASPPSTTSAADSPSGARQSSTTELTAVAAG